MTDRTPSCEERIEAHRDNREELFRSILNVDDLDDHEVLEAYEERAAFTDREQAVLNAYNTAYKEYQDAVLAASEAGKATWSFDAGDMLDPDVQRELSAGQDPDPEDFISIQDTYDEYLALFRETLQDDQGERMESAILAVGFRVEIRVDLSTGGPADFVTATLDTDDNTVFDGVYHFQDWFDGATRKLADDSPLMRMVAYYAESMDFGSTAR